MATARYQITTNGVDIDAKATAFEGEVNITKAEVIGHVNSTSLTNFPSPDQGSRNTVQIEVTGTTTTDITNAATAVGDVAIVPGTLTA